MKAMKRAFQAVLILILLTGCFSRASVSGETPLYPAKDYGSMEPEERYIAQSIDAFLFDQTALPSSTPEGTPLSWKVLSGNAEIRDYVIHKKEGAQEYEPLSLEVSWNQNSLTFDDLTLLDEKVGYVIAYFTAEGKNREQLKLAYTYNGLYWFKLNHDKGILKPSIGTGRLRDPSIVRRPGGGFVLLATQGYDSDSIYAYDSEDLITYENERVLKLNASSSLQPMSEEQAWAPEAFYDPFLHTYIIVWSSVKDGGVFYSSSDDLYTVSFPKRLMDPGYPIIDATLVHSENGFTAFLKDEREPMEEHSQIFRGTGMTWDTITDFSDPVYERHQTEGPMVQKAMEKPGWYLFVDDYTRGAYKALYTDDIEQGEMEELDDSELLIPLIKPAHGFSLPVTWKELERLMDAFDGY